MSILSQLKPKSGATHYRKRVGRGIGSGIGGTSAKGHKGQLARTGGKVRRGFEGGQTPLSRRLPKFGFSNESFKTDVKVLTTGNLNTITGDITIENLIKLGLLKKNELLKIISKGELSKKINVQAHKISNRAKEQIEKLSGKVEILN